MKNSVMTPDERIRLMRNIIRYCPDTMGPDIDHLFLSYAKLVDDNNRLKVEADCNAISGQEKR